ncbi:hypothetical protein KSS87_005726, partial [Heliosperma pusillum]
MSFSDSEGSARGRPNEHKNFRMVGRDRLLYEMLKSTSADSKAWKQVAKVMLHTSDLKRNNPKSVSMPVNSRIPASVTSSPVCQQPLPFAQILRHSKMLCGGCVKVLIMDKITVKVMSSSCKMADITDQGISLVEDLFRRREPMPSLEAIYFIQPTKENIVMFLSDMSGREPLYKKAFVFFSGPVQKELVNHIKSDMSVVPRIGALREMNLEFFPVESQVFVTDHGMALEELYGETSQNARKFDACMNTMALRIATVFASLKELPYVRYKTAKDPDTAAPHELVPSKLASAVWDYLTKYKSTIPNFPQKESCELLILDRSVDQIAPVIHEWTYDAMCHDLLEVDGNKLVLE